MQKFTDNTDGLTSYSVAGMILDNFDSEFGKVEDNENEENDEYYGFAEDFVSTGKEVNCSFDTASNKPTSEDNCFKNIKANNLSDGESRTNNNNSVPPNLQNPMSSRQVLQRHKKSKSGEESSLDKMISMMGIQLQ